MSKSLKRYCSFQEGYVNPSQKEKKYFGGNIKWLRTLDITDRYVFDTSQHLSNEGFDSAGKSAILFPKNSIAINKSGTIIGAACILKEEMCGNRAIINIVVNDEDLLMYIYYLLKYKRTELNKKAVGSIQKNLYISALETVEVTTEDKSKQVKIGDLLNSIDNIIENNNKMNSELEAIAQLYFNYWFLQYDFPNDNGKPYKSSGGDMEWCDELNKEIPKGWIIYSFNEIFSFEKGKIPDELSDFEESDFSVPYITIDVANGKKPQFCKKDKMVLCNGQSIMVMDGAASGDIYIGHCGVLGSTFAMLTSKRKDISNSMIYWIIKANMKSIKRANTGSTVPHANRRYIESMKIALPENMSFLSAVFDSIQDKINHNLKKNIELIALRDFLLPMLMNGQINFTEDYYAD